MKKSKQSSAGKKIASNIEQKPMPSGSFENPGPINNPSDHPIDNLPEATDPRWAELASMQGAQGGM